MRDTLGIRISFVSNNYCPICNKLFKDSSEKISLELSEKHVGWVHGDCKDIFYDVLDRLHSYKGN